MNENLFQLRCFLLLFFEELIFFNFFLFFFSFLFSKGITNASLTKDNILVLGNMCCTLDGSYIQNSDPYILETLKSCPDLTNAQAAAVQTMLLSGNTQYGYVNTRNTALYFSFFFFIKSHINCMSFLSYFLQAEYLCLKHGLLFHF